MRIIFFHNVESKTTLLNRVGFLISEGTWKNSGKQLMLLLITVFSCLEATGSDYKIVHRMSGYWRFSIGDDSKWSDPKYNDDDWDQIYVPSEWEKNGYDDYNGYAWYRKKFEVMNLPDESPIYLDLGTIDDVDEVYLNGKMIGKTGVFPPNYETSHEIIRKYYVPQELLNTNGINVLAIRVYDSWGPGGIRSGVVGLVMDADYALIDVPLYGMWKFKLGNKREWRDPSYNASGWETIYVPSSWESQGHPDYDGYACYRLEFKVPEKLKNESIYLSLGKIDDIDEVYLNGQYVGTVYDIANREDIRRNGREYSVPRVYYIPNHLFKFNQVNVLNVVVYDGVSRGGIYEGPIGLMTRNNYEKYRNKHDEPASFWEYLYEWLSE